jgi:hypothetical protein
MYDLVKHSVRTLCQRRTAHLRLSSTITLNRFFCNGNVLCSLSGRSSVSSQMVNRSLLSESMVLGTEISSIILSVSRKFMAFENIFSPCETVT